MASKKKNFEGPLRPGRGDTVLPPRLRPPNKPVPPGRIPVPGSPITNPRDLLPPERVVKVLSELHYKDLKKAEQKGYCRGRAKGFGVGYDCGYDAGFENGRKEGRLQGQQEGEENARRNFGKYNP